MTLLCREDLRPAACCVLDALTARGWIAQLRSGADAREAIWLAKQGRTRGLQVLWLAQPCSNEKHRELEEALDPLGRGTAMVRTFHTPAAVIEAIETAWLAKPRRQRSLRRSRSYLAHPTVSERTVDLRHWSGYGMVSMGMTAALGAVVFLGLPAPQQGVAIASTLSPAVAALEDAIEIDVTPRGFADEITLAATRPLDPLDFEPADRLATMPSSEPEDDPAPPARPQAIPEEPIERAAQPVPPSAPKPATPIAAEPGPHPDEPVAAPIADPVGLPGPRSQTVDPFATGGLPIKPDPIAPKTAGDPNLLVNPFQ